MRYVVVGVGRQGLAAVYDLVKYCEASEVLALDACFTDADVRQQVRSRLEQLLGAQASIITLREADFSLDQPTSGLCQLIRGHDCLISALPYALNEVMSQIAIESSVPMCDMGGNPAMVEKQSELAASHGHILVPECGLAPGIVNIFVKYLFEHHGANHIAAFCGGLPFKPPETSVNPLQYKLLFSPQGLVSEYMGQCPILRAGRLEFAPALSGLEPFDHQHEAFYTSNNSPRSCDYFASLGIKEYQYKTLRYSGHLAKIDVLKSLGFLRRKDNTDPELAERLAHCEVLKFDRQVDRDKVILSVKGSSDGATHKTIELIDVMDSSTGFTAMERTTSWGTTIVAYALAKGRSRPRNFATPEQFIDTTWFVEQLRRRTDGLIIH